MPPPEPRSSTVSPVAQLGDRGRVATAERGHRGGVGKLVAARLVVEAGAEYFGLLLAEDGLRRAAGGAGLGAGADAGGRRRIAAANGVADLLAVAPRPAEQPQEEDSGEQQSALSVGSQQSAWASVEQQEVRRLGGLRIGQLSHADSSSRASGIT